MATNDLDLRLRLTVDRDGKLQAVLSGTRGQLRNLGVEGERAGQRIDQGFSQARTGIESISRQLQATRQQIAAFFSIQYASAFVGRTIRLADEFKTLQARLKQATDTQEEYNQAQAGLFQIAQRSRGELSAVVDLYARIGPALKAATGSQREALAVTETILQSIQLSGSDAAASAAAIRQLAQALQAGALKGDEFVSVMEGAPALMRAIADGMGVPIGKLKDLASQGKLTAEVIAKALQKQKALVEAEFGRLPLTTEQALTKVRNQWQRFLGDLDAQTGATRTLADGIDALAEHFDQATAAAKMLAVFGGAHLASRLAQATAATIRQRQATRAQLIEERRAALAAKEAAAAELQAARAAHAAEVARSRLAVKAGAVTAATARLAAAEARYAAAANAAAAATARLSRTAALARNALALLGGPTGAIMLVSIALYDMASRAEEASRRFTDSIRGMVRSAFDDLETLNRFQLDLRLENAKGVLASLDRDIERTRRKIAELRRTMGVGELARGVFLGDNEYLRAKRRLELLLARKEEIEAGVARLERAKASPARRADFTGLTRKEIQAQAESLRAELAKANEALTRARKQFAAGRIERGALDAAQARVDDLARRLKAAQKALAGLADTGNEAVKTSADLAKRQAGVIAQALAAIERETARLQSQLAEQARRQRERLRRQFEAGLIDRQTYQQRAEALARRHARQIAQIEALADRERQRAPELARRLAELERQFRQKQITAEGYARKRLELERQLQSGLAQVEVLGQSRRGQAFVDWLAERLNQERENHRRRIEALRQAQQLWGLSEAEFQRRIEEEAQRHAETMRQIREGGLDQYLGGDKAKTFAEALQDAFRQAQAGAGTLREQIAQGLVGATQTFSDTFVDAMLTGRNAAQSFQRQLLGLVASLTKAIAKMMILEALKRAIGGAAGSYFGGGGTGGAVTDTNGINAVNVSGAIPAADQYGFAGLKHRGGIVGREEYAKRQVPARLFEGAPRYHAGGIAGNEVPTILQKGEGVFTREQMKALAPVDKLRPQVNVQVNLVETPDPGEQGQVQAHEDGGNVTLDILVATIEQKMSDNVAAGGGIAPAMERLYGLRRRGM